MRVLVGCEESGIVRRAFEAKGHEAWSNDLVPARRGGKHYRMCVKDAIIDYGPWDIIILHPDCTALAVSGNRWYGRGTDGYEKRQKAIEWTVDLWELAKTHAKAGVCLENPVGVLWKHMPSPQYVQPWQYGHKECKKTGLALWGLPALVPTDVVGPPPEGDGRKEWERVWRMAKSDTRKRDRSETYLGIAKAMADQWGG